MPATMIAKTAPTKLPFIAKRIAVIPAHNASKVRMFGTMRLNDRSESRRTRGRRIRPDRLLTAPLLSPRPPRSMRDPLSRRLLRQTVGEDGFPADHPLPGDHHCYIRWWTINIDP